MDAKPFNIEKGFMSKLLETGDFKILKDQQIKADFFTGENKRIYLYIQKVYQESSEVPTPRALLQKFPSYELELHTVEGKEFIGTDESLTYWCTQIREKALHNRLVDSTEEIAEMLDNGESQKAFSKMKSAVWSIETEVSVTTSMDITKTDDRKQAYLERKKNKGMMGIASGIPLLDYLLKGFIKETLTTLIAVPGIGKTWLLIRFAAYAQLNGYKVCFFITEMSNDIMRDRFEAMLFGMMNGDFSYSQFKAGALPKNVENDYFEFLEEELPQLEPLIVESATGVSSVVSVIERENPDIVFIDGAYLMEDDQGAKDDWLRITNISRDLKKTAKSRHLPIIINTQADKNTSKRTGPELGSIMYSQSVGQDSDNVLALFRDEIMIKDNEMGIKILKQREGVLGKVYTNWDFDTMDFSCIYSETSDGVNSQDEELEENDSNVIGV